MVRWDRIHTSHGRFHVPWSDVRESIRELGFPLLRRKKLGFPHPSVGNWNSSVYHDGVCTSVGDSPLASYVWVDCTQVRKIRQCPGNPTRSKVVIESSTYTFIAMYFSHVLSCVVFMPLLWNDRVDVFRLVAVPDQLCLGSLM